MVCNQTLWFKREFSCIGTFYWRKPEDSILCKKRTHTHNNHLRNELTSNGIDDYLYIYTICLHVEIVLLLLLIIASCPVIASIKNGIITHATLREGGEVEIKCRPGYTLVGPSKLRCIEGKWNGSLPLCKGLRENDFVVMNSE